MANFFNWAIDDFVSFAERVEKAILIPLGNNLANFFTSALVLMTTSVAFGRALTNFSSALVSAVKTSGLISGVAVGTSIGATILGI